MIVIRGAVLVLPDRVVDEGSIVIEGDRIMAIEARRIDPPAGASCVEGSGTLVVPGFIDVHVHGVEGIDVLDGPGSIGKVAARLPRFGVTAFCPTSVACPPGELDTMLAEVTNDRGQTNARILPAHLESNFINPDYNGAQPLKCIRTPGQTSPGEGGFSGADVLAVIARHRDRVGIVTVAPEIDGGLDLVSHLAAAGHRVSIGHTGATYEQAFAGIAAGIRHATHLFNRMSPMTHRAPGAPGAVLESDEVAAELICDGFHVHQSLLQIAIRAKGIERAIAITDGTAGSGLPVGTRARLGGRPIVVTEKTAELEDGTLAGSVLTMDGAFRVLVGKVGVSVIEAARMCSTTPADQLQLAQRGRLTVGHHADIAILDRTTLEVRTTLIGGEIWNPAAAALV